MTKKIDGHLVALKSSNRDDVLAALYALSGKDKPDALDDRIVDLIPTLMMWDDEDVIWRTIFLYGLSFSRKEIYPYLIGVIEKPLLFEYDAIAASLDALALMFEKSMLDDGEKRDLSILLGGQFPPEVGSQALRLKRLLSREISVREYMTDR